MTLRCRVQLILEVISRRDIFNVAQYHAGLILGYLTSVSCMLSTRITII